MLRNLLSATCVLLALNVFSQTTPSNDPDWSALMQDPSLSFEEVQAIFNEHWQGRAITPGCGWKPFKRWEALMQSRLNESGMVPNGQDIIRAHQEMMAAKANRSEAGNWMPLGPILDSQTSRADIPGVGRTNAIAFHPTDADVMFVGAPSGGLWRTYDGGNSWVSNTDQLPTLGVSAIVFDPINPNIVYIGTGDRDAADAPGLGVMRSTDGGISWELANDGIQNKTVTAMLVNPDNTDMVFAATNQGVYRSLDGAVTWNLVSNTMNYKDIHFKPNDPTIVYATGNGRFFRSTDGGESFQYVTDGIQSATRMAIAVTDADPNLVYVISTSTYAFRFLYRSTDSGASFETMSDSPNIMGWSATGDDDSGQAWYDLCMDADPVNPNRIYVGGIRMKRSDDGGATWMDIQNSYLHVDQHWCEFNPHNDDLYLCNDGGVYHYVDNQNWVDISHGIVAGQIYAFGQSPHEANTAVSGYQDNGTMEFNGVRWTDVGGGDGFECQYDPVDPEWRYTSLYYGRVYRTSPDFYGQQICGFDQLGINEEGAWKTPWLVSKHNENVMFAGLKNVWRAKNIKTENRDDIVWEKISSNLAGNDLTNMNQLIQHRADSNIVYASEGTRRLFRCDNALAEEPTWTDLSNLLPFTQVPVTALESHPTDSATLFLGFNSKVWKSVDAGNSWTEIEGALPGVAVNTICYDTLTNEGLYVGTDMGIYYKDADMEDWISFSNGLPTNSRVTEIEMYYGSSPDEHRLRAATYGRGMWESDIFNAETFVFPATAWLKAEDNSPEVYGAFALEAGFYRNLINIDVTGFDVSDVHAENATVTGITGGPDVFTVNVAPENYGLITLVIPTGAANDNDGQLTLQSDTLLVLYRQAPETMGIYGPGGVGSEDEISFWMRADNNLFSDINGSIVAEADGDKVQRWNDLMGGDLFAVQDTLDDRPTLRTNAINGFPAVEFNGENEFLIGHDFPSTVDLSVFSIAKGTEVNWNDHGWIASARVPNGFLIHPWRNQSLLSVNIYNNEGGNVSTPQHWIVDAALPQIYGLVYDYEPEAQIFHQVVNDTKLDFNANNHGARLAGVNVDVKYGWDYNNRFGEGQIAEHVIYGRRLYESHRLIVSNYFASRYGIDLGPSTLYHHHTYPHDVAGIGRKHFYDYHDDAQGRGIVRVLNPSNLGDNEFLLWGHDNGALNWENTGYPLTSPHVDRLWAYEQTGELGSVEVRIYAPELDLSEEIGLVVSDQNVFVAGQLPLFFPLTNMGEYLVATVDFPASGVFTIGTAPSVGVEDISQAEIVLYPNPASSELAVRVNGMASNAFTVQIFNTIGKKVLEVSPQSANFTIPVAGLASGMYIIEVAKDGKSTRLSFVKH